MQQKGLTTLFLLIGLFIIALAAGGFYYLTQSTKSISQKTAPLSSISTQNKTDVSPSPSVTVESEPYWHIRGAKQGMIELLVIDPQGRKTGYESLKNPSLVEIPNTTYSWVRVESDPAPPGVYESEYYFDQRHFQKGIYTLKIYGQQNGLYHLIVSVGNTEKVLISKDINGTAQKGSVDTYKIELPNLSIIK